MNEREQMKKAFNLLPENHELDLAEIRRSRLARLPAIAILIVAIFSMSFTTAYAFNEDFRMDFTMWITGSRTTAEVIQVDESTYDIAITMPDGNQFHATASSDTSLDIEEVIDHYRNLAQVMKDEKGQVMFYYRDKVRNISKLFKPLGVVVETQDADGNKKQITLADYCYYKFADRCYCIVHQVSEEENVDSYSVTFSKDSDAFPQMGFAGYRLPTYEMYVGKTKYYDEPELDESINGDYLYYHDHVIDMAGKWIPWEHSFTDETIDPATGKTLTYHHVFESYCYIKVDDLYISLRKDSFYQEEDPDNNGGGGMVAYEKDGYIPLRASDGSIVPTPEGEPVSEQPY